jgi:hypothetical protein
MVLLEEKLFQLTSTDELASIVEPGKNRLSSSRRRRRTHLKISNYNQG